MKKIFSFVAASMLATGLMTSCQQAAQPNTLTEAEKAEGWQLLRYLQHDEISAYCEDFCRKAFLADEG